MISRMPRSVSGPRGPRNRWPYGHRMDGRRSIPFGEHVIAIGFRVDGCHFSRFETGMFILEPGSKAAHILGIQRNGFGCQIRALDECLLPGSNLMPHDSSLLSAQLDYRPSFSL